MKRLFARLFGPPRGGVAPLYLHNTLSGSKEAFTLPEGVREVRMYNCGPTVYGPQHVGNLSMFVFTDVLRRALEWNGYRVKQVINFTDFGHLSSDADEGEDKMLRGLAREKLEPTLENMRALGKRYAERFKSDIALLDVDIARITLPFASDYVPAQIAMIRTLEEKGYTYATARGVYFDTSKFTRYGKLGNIRLEGLKAGARVEDTTKRHPTDFLLWKSSDAGMGWDSPWGKGFPGWHIECSAMINSILGKQIDIHTGGIEHIAVHHNNEIAQSEVATGKQPLSRFWLHRAHLQIEGAKIAKSEGNTIYLSDIIAKGYHPLSLRYLLLGTHYRQPGNFAWDALDAAQTSFLKLRHFADSHPNGTVSAVWTAKLRARINDDLDTPGLLATVWDMLKDKELSAADARATLLFADKVLGLNLSGEDELAATLCAKLFGIPVPLDTVPERVKSMIDARESARKEKDWQQADNIRAQLQKLGYSLEDTPDGPRLFRKG